MHGLRVVGALVGAAFFVASVPAIAGTAEESKVYLDKAAAAFALSRYAIAAENFEKAFELSPDPSLLYNAAQSHRLAGNKQRALELYQSYQRMYGGEKREEIEKHIENLKQAIEHDKQVATSPPVTTEPTKGAAVATPSSVPAKKEATVVTTATITKAPEPTNTGTTTVLVARPDDAREERPLTRKPWFWATVGGAVVGATVVALLLASGGDKAATPSLGRVNGNEP